MLAQAGQRIDDVSFLRADGSAVRLSELLTQPTLMIFLRHLV